MTFAGPTKQTRLAPPSHKLWEPLEYMQRAVDHLVARHAGGLALDPGLRKTSITLAAFMERQRTQGQRTMLVVAPLRICRQTWRQEGAKWTQFRELKFALLHGDKKDHTLATADADVYLINPEGIDWLCKKFFGRSLPFDIVTIDELTKFKNSASDRSKALRPRLKGVKTRWGLTGSLAPNGYMDLFGQMLMLDDGAALGRYITHFRDQYFSLGFNGFDYELQPGAEARIIKKIAPYWLQMSADDYLQLPELVEDIIEIELDQKARKVYDKMKRDMIAALPEGVITAANSAACYSKLSQMANGAVYVGDDKAKVSIIHEHKLEAIEELIEELGDQPLLIAYEFNHDLMRLRERFGVLDKATGKKVIPYLGKGTTAKQEDQWIREWNQNKLPQLFCHPASAGHGLNLQEGSASHVVWFGPIWDLELWDQFIRRLRRSGNEATRIIVHILLACGTLDELKLAALRGKDTSQGRLLKALNNEIRRDAETLAAGGTAVNYRRNDEMVAKLTRPGQEATATQEPAATAAGDRPKPASWGKKSSEEAQPEPQPQREVIQQKLGAAAEEAEVKAPRAAFGRKVEAAAEAVHETSNGVRTDQPEIEAAELAPRTRRASVAKEVQEAAPSVTTVSLPDTSAALLGQAALSATATLTVARAGVFVAVANQDPTMTVEEIAEVSNALWAEIVKF